MEKLQTKYGHVFVEYRLRRQQYGMESCGSIGSLRCNKMRDQIPTQIPKTHVDVGPYFIWQEPDGCIVRLVKSYGHLHFDFEEMGFEPALETLPYTYENNVLTVVSWIELFGWSVAVPMDDRKLFSRRSEQQPEIDRGVPRHRANKPKVAPRRGDFASLNWASEVN